MAPFNRRQIGYIQAIAGRQQHVSLTCGSDDGQIASTDSLQNAFRQPRTIGNYSNPADTDSALDVKSNVTRTTGTFSVWAKSLLLHTWHLDDPELGFDSRTVHNNDKLEPADFTNVYNIGVGLGNSKTLSVFEVPVEGTHDIHDVGVFGNSHNTDAGHVQPIPRANDDLVRNPYHIPSTARATPDGFLNSTDVKFRFTLPTDTDSSSGNPMGQDHYEFRWIVWRSKRPTARGETSGVIKDSNMDMIRNGCSFRHPGYDLFMGQSGRKRGFLGYTLNKNLDKDSDPGDPTSEQYSGQYWSNTNVWADGANSKLVPDQEQNFTVDDLMTMRLNRDDYVIMKDVRFFLGKEHGKSHFEDNLHWDWNDPIDTPETNVLTSGTLIDKNYRWHMTLLGTTNGDNPVKLNHSVRWTTKTESG